MNQVWVVYSKNQELYSLWINSADITRISNIVYVAAKPNEEMWAKVKHSRKHDPIEGKVNS